MATWQYRCQSCGGLHEVSVRPAGAMLLRCSATREWVWHEESAFLSAVAPVVRNGAGPKAAGGKTTRPRATARVQASRVRGSAKKRPASPSGGNRSRKAVRRSARSRKGRR